MAKGFARAEISSGEEAENEVAPVPEQDDASVECEHDRSDWDATDWNPEEATVQVWSGKESYPGEIIEMALRENQIHARFEKAEGRNAIFVVPQDEIRAREIVREIVEGAPPE